MTPHPLSPSPLAKMRVFGVWRAKKGVQPLTNGELMWYHMRRMYQSRRPPTKPLEACYPFSEVIEMTQQKTVIDLMEEMNLQDAVMSLLEVRLPIVIDGLDFYAGTWKGLPLHPKDIGQFQDIYESLSKDKQDVIKYSALLVNWGRRYEIQRLLHISGNFSLANAVEVDGDGEQTNADENNTTEQSTVRCEVYTNN